MRRGRSGIVAVGLVALSLAVAMQGCNATAKQVLQPVALKAGTTLDGHQAPTFSLRDQTGATVSLQQMHGHVVILTFLDATCTTECPITADYLNWTAHFLGKDTKKVGWLAISVNPTNTVHQVETFINKNSVQIPLHILMGTQATLAPLWKAYHIVVHPGSDGDIQHTLGLYVIDGQGHEREWVDGGYDPKALSMDIRAIMNEAA